MKGPKLNKNRQPSRGGKAVREKVGYEVRDSSFIPVSRMSILRRAKEVFSTAEGSGGGGLPTGRTTIKRVKDSFRVISGFTAGPGSGVALVHLPGRVFRAGT